MIKAKASDNSKFLAPAGTFPARCYQVIHLGTVLKKSAMYGDALKDQIRLSFELPTKTFVFSEEKGEQPYSLSQNVVLSMNSKSNLRKMVESWDGKKMTESEAINFDFETLLGRDCLINVVHSTVGENTYANIASISPLPEGMKCPKAVNKPVKFGFHPYDPDVFESLPQFLKDIIQTSDEWRMVMGLSPNFLNPGEEEIDIDDIEFPELSTK
jgi:hypothetical protein